MKKKKIEKISLICAFSALVITLGAIPLGSYLGYNAYVDKINANKPSSSSKPTEEIPTDPVLIKIEARLKNGFKYFDNGKANPTKDDFEVVGIYSIGKDKTIEETLSSKQYEMAVPDDFALNGGVIKFVHKEFSFDFAVKLEKVKPIKLEFITNPYTVYYKEGEKFSKDGITGNVVYNDGSKKEFDEDFLIIDNTNPLKTSDNKMKLSYKIDGEIVTGEINLTVANASNYDNGELIRLVNVGDSFIEDGSTISQASLEVRAEYESNNKVLLNNEDLIISNSSETVKFGNEQILNIASKNNSNVELKVEAYVAKTIDLSSVSTIKNGKSYLFDGDDFINEKPTSYIGDFKKDDVINFDINTSKICSTNLIMDIANFDFNKISDNNYNIKDLLLNDNISIFINNKAVEYNDISLNGYGNFTDLEKAGNVYKEINIPNLKLKKGDNNIKLKFKKDSKLKINNIKLASKGVKEKYLLGEYVTRCQEENISPSYNITKYDKITNITSKAGRLMQGACLIGDDVFYVMSTGGAQKGAVVRYNLITGEKISESEAFNLSSKVDWTYQNAGNMAYINGLLYITKVDGSLLTVNPTTMEINENFVSPFTGLDPNDKIVALEANKYMQEYVVVTKKMNNKYEMHFYDRKLNKIEDKVITLDKLNGNELQNTYSNDKYIYALYSKDGGHQFDIVLYDWNGNKINEFSIAGGTDELGTGEVGGQDRLQNIIEYNGELYVGCMLWGASSTAIYKVQYDISSFVTYESLSLGEYLSKCKDNNLEAKYTISSPIMSKHLVNGSCLTQNIVSDGKYAYIGVTTFDGSKSGCVEKYDLTTNKSILISEKFECSTTAEWKLQTAGNLCYANGKILFVTNDKGIVTLDAETLKIENTKVDFTSSNDSTNITGISYNQVTNQYVVSYKSNKSYIFDNEYKLVATLNKNTTHSTLEYQSTTSNSNYIYQTFGTDGTYATTINVFDWNGKFITSLDINTKDATNKLGNSDSGSVQCVFEFNEKIYLLVLQWNDNKGGFLYQLNMDQSILPE